MRVSTLAVEALSALLLLSSLATVSARTGPPLLVNRQQESLQDLDEEKRVYQRSPQAADQGGKKVYQPYDYGYGASPGDDDAVTSEDTDVSVTSSVGYLNTTSTSSESSDGSETPTTESASSDTTSESTITDDIYQPDPSTDTDAHTRTPEDGYPPQEPSDDQTATLADVSDGPAQESSSFWNSTESSESQITASVRTLRPPYTNTTFLVTTTSRSDVKETTITSTRILGTPGDLEPPVLTPSGFPTWTLPSSRSQVSALPPYPSNSATTVSSIPGTGTVAEGPSDSASFFSSSHVQNFTTSATQPPATSPPLNVTGSDVAHSGTGLISPTVRRTTQSDVSVTGFPSSDIVPSPTERPPFPAGNDTTQGGPSDQGTAGASSANFTTSPVDSPSRSITIEWTTLFNASHTESTADSTSIVLLPPFPSGNGSLVGGPTFPPVNVSATAAWSGTHTSSQEDDPTMFPGGWGESVSASWGTAGTSGTPIQASSPPFPTSNTTSSAIFNSTTSVYVSETESSTSETQSIFSISENITARPPLTTRPPFPSLNITSASPSALSGEITLSPAANETEEATSTPASPTVSVTPVPWPVPLPSNQTLVPFPNATTSEASVILGTGRWTSLSTHASSASSVTALPIPDTSLPPFPLPNSTVSLPSGTAVSSDHHSTISGTLAVTGSQSVTLPTVSVPYPNTTSLQISHTVLPPPLPPVTFDNTTITFSPVTDDPIPPTSAPPPFPLPNATVSSSLLGTGTPPLPIPPSLETSDLLLNATILPVSSQSSIAGVSIPGATTPWPNSTFTSTQTASANWTDPVPSRPSFPTATVIPWPVNTTASANTTEPDHTGTLFEWPMESDEPSHNSSTIPVNVTASPTWSLSATQPPFPLSNSTVSPGPTGLPSIPIPIPIPGSESVASTVSGTLIFSHTVTQEGSETSSRFSSIWANVTSTGTGLIISQTVIEEPTTTAHVNSTRWQEAGESTRTLVPPSEVTPFPNATVAVNSTGEVSGTLTLTPTTTIVTTRTSTEFLDPSTTTTTPTVDVTITVDPVESSPCITITVTHGNVTEKITKTITEPHPDLTEPASLVWNEESTSGVLPVSGETPSSVAEYPDVTTPCSSTTKPPKTRTTSCTSSLRWLNNTMTTLSISTVTTSEPYGDLSLSSVSTTSSGIIFSETSSLYSSSASASNVSFVPIPDPTTMLTSTRGGPEIEPFMRVPTTTVSDEPLPSVPDYPWGGEGPLHRHHNISSLGWFGMDSGGESGKGWWSRLKGHLGRIQAWFDREEVLGEDDFDGAAAESEWDLSDEYDLVDGK